MFGYEEALGLCVDPDRVRDKDGISAAVVACDLAGGLKAAGRSITDRLDDLAMQHGLVLTGQLSVRVDDLTLISAAMARLRVAAPTTLVGEPVTEAVDLLPRTDGLRWRTARTRVVIRPSGTEPKLKCYLQIVTPPTDLEHLQSERAATADAMAGLRAEVAGLVGLTG